MDLQQLCAVLQGCLSANPDERKAAEALLKQVLLDGITSFRLSLCPHDAVPLNPAVQHSQPTLLSAQLLLTWSASLPVLQTSA
jgi:hypothetical protein